MPRTTLWFILPLLVITIGGVLVLWVLPGQPEPAPIPSEGFTLHIDARKHINDAPNWVVHHYCRAINEEVTQCLLFDSDAPGARLIGVETVISPQLFARVPDADRANWHHHRTEIPQVDAVLPGLSEGEAQEVLSSLEDTYGKVVIFWGPRDEAPTAPVSITRPHLDNE